MNHAILEKLQTMLNDWKNFRSQNETRSFSAIGRADGAIIIQLSSRKSVEMNGFIYKIEHSDKFITTSIFNNIPENYDSYMLEQFINTFNNSFSQKVVLSIGWQNDREQTA